MSMFSTFKKFANDLVAKVDDKIQKLEVADPMLQKQKRDKLLKQSQSQKENLGVSGGSRGMMEAGTGGKSM